MIVQKLEINKDALGVFGYSFLEENAAKLRGVAIDNADPTFENIANGKYKGARRMYVYFKKQHFGVIPGLDKFMAQYVSEKTLGQDGALARKGWCRCRRPNSRPCARQPWPARPRRRML